VRRTVPTIPANDEAPQERSSAGQWEHAHDRFHDRSQNHPAPSDHLLRRRVQGHKATQARLSAHSLSSRDTGSDRTGQRCHNEYAEYVPLTIRQIFYRLVGAHGYEKTENAYSRLCSHISNARRDGLIDFEHIRDDGLTDLSLPTWISGLHMTSALIGSGIKTQG
jgi:hypothetical protein